jgi:hypothetical protein
MLVAGDTRSASSRVRQTASQSSAYADCRIMPTAAVEVLVSRG